MHVDGLWHVGLPVAGDAGVKNKSEEDVGKHSSDGDRAERASCPALGRCGGLERSQGEVQSVLRGAGGHTLHAGAALGGADLHELVDGQGGGTGSRAFAAVDAGFGIPADFDGAEQRGETHESAVGAKVAAPEVLDEHGEQHEQAEDDGGSLAHVAEEVEHANVGHEAIRRGHEELERGSGHGSDEEEEEAKQQIFEAA